MKYELEITKSFKKDYKKLNREEIIAVDNIIEKLLNGEMLDVKNHEHFLTGNYKGCIECHVKPDLLLVYERHIKELVLVCLRVSSHTEIFGIKKRKK